MFSISLEKRKKKKKKLLRLPTTTTISIVHSKFVEQNSINLSKIVILLFQFFSTFSLIVFQRIWSNS